MKRIVWIIAAALVLGGCSKQRDLYGISHPLLYIEGDWMPSLGTADMTQKATALLYKRDGSVDKGYFMKPNSVTFPVSEGVYDVLVVNGLMYSPGDTHLDNIVFEQTDCLETFEACVKEAPANKRLSKQEGEFIASNDMEILSAAWGTRTITGNNDYYLKYKNGQNGYPAYPDYVEASLYLTPRAVSYNAQVVVHLVNPGSAFSASGALRGFAGRICLHSRMPAHDPVTHHLKLNSLHITHTGTPGDPSDPELGTIESPVFVTFGPPLDMAGRRYEFEISITLKDGSTVNKIFDITDQILSVIEALRANLDTTRPQVEITIPIDLPLDLPVIVEQPGVIGVSDWGEDEIIRIPIK